VFVVLYFWSPSEQTLHVFFIVVIVWGIGDGMILNQSMSKYLFCQIAVFCYISSC